MRSLAFLDLYHGRYGSAQSRLEQSLEILKGQNSPLSVARVHLLLAIVAEGQGDGKAQRWHLDTALESLHEVQSKVVFGALLGLCSCRFPGGSRKDSCRYRPDRRSTQLRASEFDKAIELLQRSDKENSTGLSIEALVRAYQQSGRLDEAVLSFEKVFNSSDRAQCCDACG